MAVEQCMNSNKTHHREKIALLFFLLFLAMTGLMGRLIFLMIFRSEHYSAMAEDLHERERTIKAARGNIIDANGTVIATNRTVCTISVIHNQIKQPDEVVAVLSRELGISEDEVRKKVEKYSSREIIKTNVDKALGDQIRTYHLAGVKVDEDYKRYYPYDTLASKVLGFTGGDNQGIIGLEVKYEQYLKGTNGKILTMSDAAGIEIENAAEDRIEPVAGQDLQISLDVNIQRYCEQAAYQVMEKKSAKKVSIIVMNPQNGEIMAMVNAPEFNLNDPFTLNTTAEVPVTDKEKQDLLNQMWRNPSINDTYEPGSTFKIITAAAGLEAGVVKLDDHFSCPGFRVVEDRKIRCHKTTGHGAETFKEGVMNSCNPVFMEVGARVGVDGMYTIFRQMGLFEKTGIDIPGEANSIMHNKKNVGAVELATMSFGQSFQITPLQLMRAASAAVNGGTLVTPHFGMKAVDSSGKTVKTFEFAKKKNVIKKETSETMRELLEAVVSEGSGRNCKIEGYSIGGKTATSEKLPRGTGKYISSFLGFSKAEHPTVMALVMIDEPKGTYYGGTIAAPVVREVFKVALPYLGISKDYTVDKTKK